MGTKLTKGQLDDSVLRMLRRNDIHVDSQLIRFIVGDVLDKIAIRPSAAIDKLMYSRRCNRMWSQDRTGVVGRLAGMYTAERLVEIGGMADSAAD